MPPPPLPVAADPAEAVTFSLPSRGPIRWHLSGLAADRAAAAGRPVLDVLAAFSDLPKGGEMEAAGALLADLLWIGRLHFDPDVERGEDLRVLELVTVRHHLVPVLEDAFGHGVDA